MPEREDQGDGEGVINGITFCVSVYIPVICNMVTFANKFVSAINVHQGQ
jgi:hypothetical protein